MPVIGLGGSTRWGRMVVEGVGGADRPAGDGGMPPAWLRAQVYYRQVGWRREHEGAAVDADGRVLEPTVPDEIVALFEQVPTEQLSRAGRGSAPGFDWRARTDLPRTSIRTNPPSAAPHPSSLADL